MASVGKSYEDILEDSAGFDNPQCIEHLSQLIGLDTSVFYTNMSGLRGKYPNEEYATELRQSQASSWAFRYEFENSMHTMLDGNAHFSFKIISDLLPKALNISKKDVTRKRFNA